MIEKNNYFILTGPPGAGKSSILNLLKEKGVLVIEEPARQIIAEQRLIEGKGLYDKNKHLFLELMLSRAIYTYKQMLESTNIVVFDRGIPDLIGYAQLFGIDHSIIANAAQYFRYNTKVLFAPFWSEIYVNDDERKMTAKEANEFGSIIKQGFLELSYQTIDIPLDSISSRVDFIVHEIHSHNCVDL